MHTDYHAELQGHICLNCDECFYLAVEDNLVCPKCGNHDEEGFSDVTPPEDRTEEIANALFTFQP